MKTHTFPTLDAHYAAVLGITKPWVITSTNLSIEDATFSICISHTGNKGRCPECNKLCPVEDLREERTWRHLDMMQFVTSIKARAPRVRCSVHGIKTMKTPWAGPRSHFTLLFEHFAIKVLESTESITKATTILRISWHQAQLLMKRAVDRGMSRRQQDEAITYVGVDEKSFLKGHSYASIATDIIKGQVLDVEEGRTKEATEILLQRAIPEQVRSQVCAGAMDMWQPFMDGWQTVMGEDKPIVHNKFHVSGYLGKAVDTVRKQEHKQFKTDGKDILTKTKYLWLKNPDNWKDDERAKFRTLKVNGLKVGRAWAIKEAFRKFWTYSSIRHAMNFFNRWYFWATHSRLPSIIAVAKMLKRHLAGLLSYCIHSITNAVTEGLNSKIQSIKANARGFRTFSNYRTSILFHCGKLEMLP